MQLMAHARAVLTVNNVWTHVAADAETYEYLRRKMRTWVKGAERRWEFRSKQWDGYEYHFTQNAKFRTGLLENVSDLIQNEVGREVVVVDERERPYTVLQPVDLLGKTNRDYQLDAVEIAIEQGRGIIKHGTSGGKTVTTAQLVQRLNVRTLFLVDQTHLAVQTSEEWASMMGHSIGLFAEGLHRDDRIVCATFATVNAMLRGKKRQWCLDWLAQFDCLIVDECHHLVAPTYQAAADKCAAYFRFGCSATPFKSKGNTNVRTDNDDPAAVMHVTGTAGPVLHEFNAEDLEEGGYVVPCDITMWNWREPKWEPRWKDETADFDINDDNYSWSGRKATKKHRAEEGLYHAAIIDCPERNDAVVKRIAARVAEGYKVLVQVEKQEHAQILKRLVQTHYDRNDVVGIISGKNRMDARKALLAALASGTLPVLIGTTVLDEGVNVPEISALVLAGGGKAQHRNTQRLGRGQRLMEGKDFLPVDDFFDTHSKLMWIHSQKRLANYRGSKAYTVRVT